MCNDALNKQMDAQINSIKKCEELRKELKNKEHSISDIEKLDLIISETKSTTIFKRNVKQDTKN